MRCSARCSFATRDGPPGCGSTEPSPKDRLPHKEVFDGVLIILGGALLITPGFITDIFGLVLLIPPTRAIVRAISLPHRPQADGDGRKRSSGRWVAPRPAGRLLRARDPPGRTRCAAARSCSGRPVQLGGPAAPPRRPRPTTSRGPGRRSGTRTSSRPAGSHSADERSGRNASSSAGSATQLPASAALAWDLGEPGALLLTKAEGSRAATFALEEGGDAATLEHHRRGHGHRGDPEPAHRRDPARRPRRASRSPSCVAEVSPEGRLAELPVLRADQPLERRSPRGRGHISPTRDRRRRRRRCSWLRPAGSRVAEHGEERTRAWLIRGEDDARFEDAFDLHPVRRRTATRPASASSSGRRRPSERAEPPPPGSRRSSVGGVGVGNAWAGLFRCQTDGILGLGSYLLWRA